MKKNYRIDLAGMHHMNEFVIECCAVKNGWTVRINHNQDTHEWIAFNMDEAKAIVAAVMDNWEGKVEGYRFEVEQAEKRKDKSNQPREAML